MLAVSMYNNAYFERRLLITWHPKAYNNAFNNAITINRLTILFNHQADRDD